MTQVNTNPPGWIISIVLHVGVFFVLLNTPILKEYITPPSFFTVHLIHEETYLSTFGEKDAREVATKKL